ncbi:MAG: ABC transporter ATP-binding protein [Parvibaculaceae bacterium]
MSELIMRAIAKSFGKVEVLKDIDLEVKDREFVVLVGPSGCGKSTLLRIMAGLEEMTAGDLFIDGQRMNDVPAAKRGLAMVFQSYALYPHMTVAENMSVGLRIAGERKDVIASKVGEAARILQLDALLDRLPKQLSGGQRQRVAIGRAIVRHPKVFLFDEPLSNLDAALRLQMRLELAKLHRQLDATMIYVTHDQVEAMTLADKIVVMNAGRIEQIGSPLDLYRRPRNLFVAGFLGSPKMNFLPGTVKSSAAGKTVVALASGGELMLAGQPAKPAGAKVTLGVRPEALVVGAATASALAIAGKALVVERLGSETILYLGLADGTQLTVKADGSAAANPGDEVTVGVIPEAVTLFGADGLALRPAL